MTWVAVGTAGTTLISGGLSAHAQDKAAEQAAKGNKQAQKLQQEAALAQQEQLAPWRTMGMSAMSKLNDIYGLGAMAQVQPQQTAQDVRQFAIEAGGIGKKGQVKKWAEKAAPYGLEYYDWAKTQGGVK